MVWDSHRMQTRRWDSQGKSRLTGNVYGRQGTRGQEAKEKEKEIATLYIVSQ